MEADKKELRLAELRDQMTPKQLKFCEEYIITLNGYKAAIAAGYSEKTARGTASENRTKPHIREYIALRLQDCDADESEITKMIVDRAKTTLNEFLVEKEREAVEYEERPINERIEAHKLKIKKLETYLKRADHLLNEAEKERAHAEIQSYEKEIIKDEIELDANPAAVYEVSVKTKVKYYDLDLEKLAKAKDNGLLKSLSFGQYGVKVELTDADANLRLLTQIKGMITNKIEAENNNVNKNVNVEVTDEEAQQIANAIFKEIT